MHKFTIKNFTTSNKAFVVLIFFLLLLSRCFSRTKHMESEILGLIVSRDAFLISQYK